jgi:hypothetical protein
MKKITSGIWLTTSIAVCSAADAPTPAPGTFRIKFLAYDGDPKTPEKMEFQINPLDAGNRTTSFVKLGDVIDGTKLRLIKFEFKEAKNAAGEQEDVSELTVRDTASGKVFVLPMNKAVSVSVPAK